MNDGIGRVLVLGANGRLGRAAARAFAAAGWSVVAQVRRAPADPLAGGVEYLECEIADAARIVARARGAEVVVNGLNPIYTRWAREAMPMARAAIDIATALGALLMLPGNVYNFGRAMPALLDEAVPFAPTTSKGRIRVAIERAIEDATTRGLRAVVVRAGDFYGGDGRGSWLDLAIARDLGRGIVTYPGPPDVVHAWAWLPDLARAFVCVAQARDRLAAFESIHFPGHAVTGADWTRVLASLTGRRLRRRDLPWTLMRWLSPVMPMWRAVLEMRYLWQVPHALAGARLQALAPGFAVTRFEAAVAETLGGDPALAAALESRHPNTA